MNRRSLASVLALLLAAGAGGCSSSSPESDRDAATAGAPSGSAAASARAWKPSAPDTLGPVVAVVGNRRIRASEIDSIIATAPPNIQPQLRDKDGYRNLVDRVVTEETVYQAAKRSGIESEPSYRASVARSAREILMREYYQRRIAAMPPPSDSMIQAYYAEHPSEFEIQARARVRHIQLPTRAKAEALRKRIVAGGLWDQLARANSTDTQTRNEGGVVGFVTPGTDFVPVIGKAPAIVAAAFALREGETSQPIKSDKGWHLIRVDSVEPKRLQPIDQVRDRIRAQLSGAAEQTYSKALLDSLREAANATVFDDSIDVAMKPRRTAQEFFKEAQAAVDPRQRIGLYREVVRQHPDDPVSIQAAFMIGFTYAEDLAEFDQARVEFQAFLAKHPNSELANSARWMLENMDKPAPELEDAPGEEGRTGAPPDTTR